MISPDFATPCTLALYAGGALAGLWGLAARSPWGKKCGCWLTAAAFGCQTLLLALGFHRAFPLGLSVGAYLQMLAWFLVLCSLFVWWLSHQETALIFAAPLCLILFAMSLPYQGFVVRIPQALKGSFYALHIGALFLSLGLICVGFIASGLFLFLESRIKGKLRMKGFWQDMPALSVLDTINAWASMLAFPLYTLGLVAGLLWAKPAFGATVSGDPKEVVSIVIWLLLAILFHNRLAKSWRGHKPARLFLFIFALCLFSFGIVNTVMNTHHAFGR